MQQPELVVLVDQYNNPIGTELKSEVHHSSTPLHRAFSLFLFDEQGRLLLQQRAMGKVTWPGVWSNSCCGHPLPGEATEDAVIRRTEYELGIIPTDLMCALPDFEYRAELQGIVENEICPVYLGRMPSDTQLSPHPGEVAAIEWVTWEQFRLMAEQPDPDRILSPWSQWEAVELEAGAELSIYLPR